LGLLVKTQERNGALPGWARYTEHALKTKPQSQKRARVAGLPAGAISIFGKTIGHGPGWQANPSGGLIYLFDKASAQRLKSRAVSLTFFFPQSAATP